MSIVKLNTEEALSRVYMGAPLTEYQIDFKDLEKLFGEPTFVGGPKDSIAFEWVFEYNDSYFWLFSWEALHQDCLEDGFVWEVSGTHRFLLRPFLKYLDLWKQLLREKEECHRLNKMANNSFYTEDERAIWKQKWADQVLKYNQLKTQLDGNTRNARASKS